MAEVVCSSETWVENSADLVVVGADPGIDTGVSAAARNREIVFHRQSNTCIDLASRSDSGNWFGIQIDAVDMTQTGYVEVKIVDGEASLGW